MRSGKTAKVGIQISLSAYRTIFSIYNLLEKLYALNSMSRFVLVLLSPVIETYRAVFVQDKLLLGLLACLLACCNGIGVCSDPSSTTIYLLISRRPQ